MVNFLFNLRFNYNLLNLVKNNCDHSYQRFISSSHTVSETSQVSAQTALLRQTRQMMDFWPLSVSLHCILWRHSYVWHMQPPPSPWSWCLRSGTRPSSLRPSWPWLTTSWWCSWPPSLPSTSWPLCLLPWAGWWLPSSQGTLFLTIKNIFIASHTDSTTMIWYEVWRRHH